MCSLTSHGFSWVHAGNIMGRVWKSEKKPQVNLGISQCSPCPACESQFRIRGFTQNEVIVGIRGNTIAFTWSEAGDIVNLSLPWGEWGCGLLFVSLGIQGKHIHTWNSYLSSGYHTEVFSWVYRSKIYAQWKRLFSGFCQSLPHSVYETVLSPPAPARSLMPLLVQPTPRNHWLVFCLPGSALSRKSYKWSHSVYSSQVALAVRSPPANAGWRKRRSIPASIPRFDPWLGMIPWRRKWQPTPVCLPQKSHGQRSQAGYSPEGRTELDMTEAAEHLDRMYSLLSLAPVPQHDGFVRHPYCWVCLLVILSMLNGIPL